MPDTLITSPDAPELAAWLRLTLTPGVGPITARRLLAVFGSPQAIFNASAAELRETTGPALVQALAAPPAELAAQLERTQRWLSIPGPPRQLLTLEDPQYPQSLRQLSDAPTLLYLLGELRWLRQPALAIVGSRQCSPQGREHALQFAKGLSQAGLTLVSGLALGIDGAAHEGALQGPGSTIAVVATGLDIVYPRRHRELAHRIAEQGLLLSEFPLGTSAQPVQFPRRNRVIAGLSLGVLVVEAGLPSGTLITAQLAADHGREVFAIPGPIHAAQSKGCHQLIKQGAHLVESVEDILEALPPLPQHLQADWVMDTARTTTAPMPTPALAPAPTLSLGSACG
jgi:DNA processing protein